MELRDAIKKNLFGDIGEIGTRAGGQGNITEKLGSILGLLGNMAQTYPATYQAGSEGGISFTNVPQIKQRQQQTLIEKYRLKPKIGPKGTEWASPDIFDRMMANPIMRQMLLTSAKSGGLTQILMMDALGNKKNVLIDDVEDALNSGFRITEE